MTANATGKPEKVNWARDVENNTDICQLTMTDNIQQVLVLLS